MADQDMMEDDEIVQEDTWEVIRKYFDENGLVQQQRSSYNEFILQNIQEVSSLPVTGISLLLFTYGITLGKAHCSRGDLTRSEGSGLRELGAHVEGTLCVLAAPALACGCCRKNARRHLFVYCESVSGMALPMFHGAAGMAEAHPSTAATAALALRGHMSHKPLGGAGAAGLAGRTISFSQNSLNS